jgi:hypothetical protein
MRVDSPAVLDPDIPAPTRCFCQFPLHELFGWAQKKYVEHASTLQLLQLARDRRQREAVSIVALLDVPDEDILHMLTPLAPAGCRILVCRDHVKRWLHDMLAMHTPTEEVAP